MSVSTTREAVVDGSARSTATRAASAQRDLHARRKPALPQARPSRRRCRVRAARLSAARFVPGRDRAIRDCHRALVRFRRRRGATFRRLRRGTRRWRRHHRADAASSIICRDRGWRRRVPAVCRTGLPGGGRAPRRWTGSWIIALLDPSAAVAGRDRGAAQGPQRGPAIECPARLNAAFTRWHRAAGALPRCGRPGHAGHVDRH